MRKTLFATAAVLGLALAGPAMAQSMFVPANNGAPRAVTPPSTAESATQAYGETEPSPAAQQPQHYGFTAPIQQDGMGAGQDGNHH